VLGTLCAGAGITAGTYGSSEFLRADYGPDHPLAALNEDETPGDADYYTIRETENPLFWNCERSRRSLARQTLRSRPTTTASGPPAGRRSDSSSGSPASYPHNLQRQRSVA
jgi:hypothetical protein